MFDSDLKKKDIFSKFDKLAERFQAVTGSSEKRRSAWCSRISSPPLAQSSTAGKSSSPAPTTISA
jgi:hypothetical protein